MEGGLIPARCRRCEFVIGSAAMAKSATLIATKHSHTPDVALTIERDAARPCSIVAPCEGIENPLYPETTRTDQFDA